VVNTSEKRYTSLVNLNAFTTSANTDIITDTTITEDGILRIGLESVSAADWRIALNQTNFTTFIDSAADIWQTVEIPVSADDVLQFQTVDIETVSMRVILDTGGFYVTRQV